MARYAKMSSPNSLPRTRLSGVAAGAVGVFLAVVLIFGVYLASLARTASEALNHQELLPDTSGSTGAGVEVIEPVPGDIAAAHPGPNTGPTPVDTTPHGQQPGRDVVESKNDSLNFLIVGSDKASGGGARADVIILAHLSGNRQRVDLVHIPRDYYVNIPGVGYDRINASYTQGGAPLLVDTVQDVTGVKIAHVAITDFSGFEEVVDAVGGVEVTVKESSAAINGSPAYTKGQFVHMDGKEALNYARQRKNLKDGDIGRGRRQMDLIAALGGRVMTPEVLASPAATSKLVSSVAGSITTDNDLTTARIVSLMASCRGIGVDDIHSHTAPWSGTPMRQGMSVVDPEWVQMEVLHDALVNDTMEEYSG